MNTTLPMRLNPGDDLRDAIQAAVLAHGCRAAFVLAGVGSLAATQIRLAGAEAPSAIAGDVEILTLSGSVSPQGVHLHIAVSDAAGRVVGGHVAPGCAVRTTAELLLALLPEWEFTREPDARTGFRELVLRERRD